MGTKYLATAATRFTLVWQTYLSKFVKKKPNDKFALTNKTN